MKLPTVYDEIPPKERWKVREEYVKLQKGMCYYCYACLKGLPEESIAKKKVTPKFYPTGFFDHPVHLHHSHVTGMTIGAVHAHCNAVLWEYEGD